MPAHLLLSAFVVACLLALPSSAPAADAQRQAEVARRGANVMPFDLAKTTHVFTKTRAGGIQRVVAKNPADAPQVRLVREHLSEIRTQFLAGDFSAPAQIHGAAMPGLAALKAAPSGAVAVAYREVSGGAELVYSSRDPRLVHALHRWFDAQLSDHGHDAMAGHMHPH
ncbi:MAG: aspartate carbamoyltransferase [Caldimonas sp.]